jgi:hypothetical protein
MDDLTPPHWGADDQPQAPASGASGLEGRLREAADPDGRIPLPIMNQEGSRAGVARRTPEEILRVEAFRDERGTVWMPPTAWAYFSACRARDIAADALASARAALKPFADCCEQINDDESDEEWAKFRLLVGDYRRARAFLAAQSARPPADQDEAKAREDAWQPIETAPRDGTYVDLWEVARDRRHGKRIADVRWDRKRSFNGGIGRVAQPDAWCHRHGGQVWFSGYAVTHWRPLPPPPALEQGDVK